MAYLKNRFMGLGIVLMSLTGCPSEPEWPVTPFISFQSAELISKDRDTVVTTIRFRDGDGDLGLNTEDLNGLFADTNPNGTVNLNSYNFWIDIFRKLPTIERWDSISPVVLSSGREFIGFYGRFPRLSDNTKPAPLEGSISHKISAAGGFPIPSSVQFADFKFRIRILDRSRNRSNRIETTPIRIRRR